MSDRPNPVQFLRAALPHVIAVVVLMVIAGNFYSKSFDGYRLRMPDIEHYIATSKEVNDHRDRTGGEQALWTDSQFGGMPTFQLGMRTSDVNAGSWFSRVLRMGFPRPADHLLVALLCAYLLASVLGCGPWISALGGHWFWIEFDQHSVPRSGACGEGDVDCHTARVFWQGCWWPTAATCGLGAGLAAAFTAINLVGQPPANDLLPRLFGGG